MKKCKKLGAERLSEFFRQFSVLVESGLSIPETLEIMQQDDTDREFCLACRKLGAFMTEGNPGSDDDLSNAVRISGDPADVRADPGGCDAAASYKNPHGDQPFSVCVPLFPASGGCYDPGRMEDPDGKSMVSLQL